ncbi:hypothetical protein [Paraburkholderia sp. HD33-4]|uniref:hypothetical protein n=1 Tax=Paraburkholderia sp. HD33-4 TaxID=2883242 RepID=UPI001F17CCE9|nr:hypothetical protein [Paraburkholderia sp. HD33-4]
MMKVCELMELLEGMPEDAEVRIAQQPNWPFEYAIAGVVCVDLGRDEEDDDMRDDYREPVVYLAEGTQLGYLPGAVSSELGWR